MQGFPKKLTALLSACTVLAVSAGLSGAALPVRAAQGPDAYDFTGENALTQAGVTASGAVYIPCEGAFQKTVFTANNEQTPPTNMAALDDSNSALQAVAGFVTNDQGAFHGFFLRAKETASVWTETFWADDGKFLNSLEIQLITQPDWDPVLKVELSATEAFAEKTEFTAERVLVERPDVTTSRLYTFKVPAGTVFPTDARFARLSFSRIGGEVAGDWQFIVREIKLGMQTAPGYVTVDADMDASMTAASINADAGSLNVQPVEGTVQVWQFLQASMSHKVHAIGPAGGPDAKATSMYMVFQHDREIDQFGVDVGCSVEKSRNVKVYLGTSKEQVTGDGYENRAVEVVLSSQAIRNEREGVVHNGLRYFAKDTSQLFGKGYTFIRIQMEMDTADGYWNPYITEINLYNMSEADRIAAMYVFPEAKGNVDANGGDLLVDGTHNLAADQCVLEGYLDKVYKGKDGDANFHGVFRVPEAYRGKLKSLRILKGYGGGSADTALRFTTAADLPGAGDVGTWQKVPLVYKEGFTNNGDSSYTAYIANPGAISLADATYVYFEHPQNSDASTAWYDGSRGCIRAVQFTAEEVKGKAEIVMDAPGLLGFRAAVNLGGLTPEQAADRLQFLVSDNPGDYTAVSPRFEETSIQGVYAVTAKEVLPEGLSKLKILLQGPIDSAQAVSLQHVALYYAGDSSYAVTAESGANGSVDAPATATFGESVTVTVTPDDTYMLDTLTVTAASGAAIPVDGLTFVMPREPVTVHASFKSAVYTVTVESGSSNGSITAPAAGAYNTPVEIQVTADEGYMLDKIDVIGQDGQTLLTVRDNTFTMPAQNVTLRAAFRYREIEALESLGASIRFDPSKTEGKRGIRFMARLTDEADDGKLTIDGREYAIESYGFYRVKDADLAAVGGELSRAAFEAHGDKVSDIPFEKAIADEVTGGNRQVTYAAVLKDITDSDQYAAYTARPYIRASRDGKTVYFYGETVSKSIYGVKIHGKQRQTVSLEAAVLRGEAFTNLSFHTIVQGSVRVEGQEAYKDFVPGKTVFTEGADYEVDYAAGRIRRLPGSRIANYADNAAAKGETQTAENFWVFDAAGYTLHVSYTYVTEAVSAYGFEANTTLKEAAAAVKAAAGSPAPSTETSFAKKLKEGGVMTYLVIGDSISTGAQYTPSSFQFFHRIAADLESRRENLEVRVKNYAVGGAWANNGVEQMTKAKAAGYEPDLITLAFGMNDQANYADAGSITQYINDYKDMVAYAKAQWPEAQIVLVTPMPPADIFVWNGKHTGEYAQALVNLAKEQNLPVADVYGMFNHMKTAFGKDDGELVITNANHPGPYGHELYAQAIGTLFDGLDG